MAIETNAQTLLTPKAAVGVHERGHEAVAKAFSRVYVKAITAEPNGNILGQTTVVIHESDPIRYITKRIAILEGSILAEEKVGIKDHQGCNHDQSVIRALVSQVSSLKGEAYASAVLSEATSLAHNAIRQYNTADLIWLGQTLAGDITNAETEELTAA